MEQPKDLFEQYIETIQATQARINAKGMWKWIHVYEADHNIMLTEMRTDQICAMLDSRYSTSPATIRNYILVLRSFFAWMQNFHMRADNPAEMLSYRNIDYAAGIKVTYWPNYLMLLNTLNRIWTPDEGLPVYPATVFAWVGIPVKIAGEVKRKQVDLNRQVIEVGDQNFSLTDEMTDILQRYDSFKSARRDNRMTMVRTYTSDTFLYRSEIQNRTASETSKNPVNAVGVLSAASKVLTTHHLRSTLKYSELVKSGWLHRMYLMECEGHELSDVLEYGKAGLNIPTAYPGDALLIYQNYKKAFNLN
mgnify:CR=1 FL=1|nr:MAG TPA: SITE-SPECIFIC RECOMBINASE XERD, RECOMBINASE, DNA BINDING, DNA.5A [Caudoviricetes sp.]